jgi:hypothetical protein
MGKLMTFEVFREKACLWFKKKTYPVAGKNPPRRTAQETPISW